MIQRIKRDLFKLWIFFSCALSFIFIVFQPTKSKVTINPIFQIEHERFAQTNSIKKHSNLFQSRLFNNKSKHGFYKSVLKNEKFQKFNIDIKINTKQSSMNDTQLLIDQLIPEMKQQKIRFIPRHNKNSIGSPVYYKERESRNQRNSKLSKTTIMGKSNEDLKRLKRKENSKIAGKLKKWKPSPGVFWPEVVDKNIPKGILQREAELWMKKARQKEVTSLTPAEWKMCGRAKNAFVQMEGGLSMCARYRDPMNRLVQGEVLSYWLASTLNLSNVPPVILSEVNSGQWKNQQNKIETLGWNAKSYVALIMWVEDLNSEALSNLYLPKKILQAYEYGKPVCKTNLQSDLSEAMENNTNVLNSLSIIAQWGNLILFDYLTGNYDRIASMQDSAEKEKKPRIMRDMMRNIKKSYTVPYKLWYIDNESGLLDAYHLIYLDAKDGPRFKHFHRQMLQTLCIFQESTIMALHKLYRKRNPQKYLEKLTLKMEPLFQNIQSDESFPLFEKHFNQRLKEVVQWIQYCESLVSMNN